MADAPSNPTPTTPPTPPPPPATPAASTAVRSAPAAPKQLPPYRVLLHNDDVNDMLTVVQSLLELTTLDLEGAKNVMWTAHTRGVALVLVTHKERAELYQDQFRSKRLTVTIEPAEA